VATKKERQRELARQAYERRLDRQVQRARRTRQVWFSAIAAVVVVGAGTGVAAAAGAFTPTSVFTCKYTVSGTAARKVTLPPQQPDLSATYTAKITTNRGVIKINLLNSKAACTVNSFSSLARQKFFNNTSCHRLTTSGIYVLQCGDPTGSGSGGPGYEFYTENLNGATYPAGTVAMARAQSKDSNGSQFFLVYKNSPLPASYTPFGTITSGLSVLQAVAKAGTDNSNGAGDGHPKEKVQIESVTITKA
jgi:peptidyl-prolyl cis-trans isomerase B (cyclophilin B)